MIYDYIDKLLAYGIEKRLLSYEDVDYSRNRNPGPFSYFPRVPILCAGADPER